MPARIARALLAVGSAACLLPVGAAAAPLDDARLRIDGAAPGDGAGARVSEAGDVNGDGRPDVIVGAPGADTGAGVDAGAAYVVFGQAASTTVNLGALGTKGFRIARNSPGPSGFTGEIGRNLSGAGDFNGDGLDDIVVGDVGADASAEEGQPPGQAFVVFGKASSTAVDLSALGNQGVRIDNVEQRVVADAVMRRTQVDGAGDVNGDGRDDVVLGAPGFRHLDAQGNLSDGAAHVIFGSASTQTLDGHALGSRGFTILGGPELVCCSENAYGTTVAGAGDVNGDGRGDVMIGQNDGLTGIPGEHPPSSAVDVVFGKATTSAVRSDAMGYRGFRVFHGAVEGAFGGDRFSEIISGVGDLNGDGRDDVGLGAPRFWEGFSPAFHPPGAAWVLFGRGGGGTIDVFAPTPRLELFGADGDNVGQALTGGVDLDGDGFDDVAVLGSRIFIVHGRIPNTPQGIQADELVGGAAGIIDASGNDLAGIADGNGDGRDELLLGRSEDDPGGRADAGSAYLLQSAPPPCTITGTPGNDVLTGTSGDDVICGRGGADTINARGGNDTVYGNTGNDRLFGSDGTDVLHGDQGDDQLKGDAGPDQLRGGPGNDLLYGGAGTDALLGGTGTDRLLGEGDNDTLNGQDGADTVEGGEGDDTLSDEPGGDFFIRLYTGNDTLRGGNGNDILRGGYGNDLVYGDAGNDDIDGFVGSDRLFGVNGNDHIVGGDGADLLNGGDGSDALEDRFEGIPPDFDRDVIDTFQCGSHVDSVIGSSFDNISADCENVQKPNG